MKRRILSLCLAAVLCIACGVTVFAETDTTTIGAIKNRLYDEADLLTEAEESSLISKLDTVSEKHKVDVIVVTVDSIGDSGVEAYAEDYYDDHSLGYGTNRDGVMLLISMEYRDYCVLSKCASGETLLSVEICDEIGETVSESLSEDDYVEAFETFADESDYQINGTLNGFPFDYGKNLLIALGVGLVVALIVTGSMKSKLKSVRKQPNATEYTKPGSMQITLSNEFFLYRVVDRQKKESSSSGSSSGSSCNASSGKF